MRIRSGIIPHLLLALLTILLAASAPSARAQVSLTLNPATLVGAPGDTVTFSGDLLIDPGITAADNLMLSGLSFASAGLNDFPATVVFDTTNYDNFAIALFGTPATSVDNLTGFPFFDVILPSDIAAGFYTARADLEFFVGNEPVTTSANFSVQVAPSGPIGVIPEPGTLLILSGATGVAALEQMRRRRGRSAKG